MGVLRVGGAGTYWKTGPVPSARPGRSATHRVIAVASSPCTPGAKPCSRRCTGHAASSPPAPAPKAHFRTSVHAAPEFAAAIARLAVDVDEQLGEPSLSDRRRRCWRRRTARWSYGTCLAPALRSRIELTAVECDHVPATCPTPSVGRVKSPTKLSDSSSRTSGSTTFLSTSARRQLMASRSSVCAC